MKHDRPTEDTQEKAALYALGTLNQHEAGAFEAHLREGCTVCRTLVYNFKKVVAAAGCGAPEIEAPTYLRDLLASRIEREPLPTPRRPILPPPPTLDLRRPPAQAMARPPARKRLSAIPWLLVVILVAAAAYAFWRRMEADSLVAREREKAVDSQRLVAEMRASLQSQRDRARNAEMIMAALRDPGTRAIMLVGRPVAPSAAGAVLWSTSQNRWIITASLPPASPDKEYQLWLVRGSVRESAALLKQDSEGRVFAMMDVLPELSGLTGAAISLEQRGGSERPTTIYAFGTLGPR